MKYPEIKLLQALRKITVINCIIFGNQYSGFLLVRIIIYTVLS